MISHPASLGRTRPRSGRIRRGQNLEFDLGDLIDSGAAVTVVTFRPSPTQSMLVVAAQDTAAVERVLRPHLGARLCVVPSRWTRTELDAVRDHLRHRWDAWRLDTVGEAVDDHGQASITVRMMRVTDDIATWAATLPDELLTLHPSLTPVGHPITP